MIQWETGPTTDVFHPPPSREQYELWPSCKAGAWAPETFDFPTTANASKLNEAEKALNRETKHTSETGSRTEGI